MNFAAAIALALIAFWVIWANTDLDDPGDDR